MLRFDVHAHEGHYADTRMVVLEVLRQAARNAGVSEQVVDRAEAAYRLSDYDELVIPPEGGTYIIKPAMAFREVLEAEGFAYVVRSSSFVRVPR